MATVLVTGANGGLGQVVTQTLLNEGHCVIAPQQAGDKLKNLLDHFANSLFVYKVDLADEIAVRTFVQQVISQHGPIDAAVLLAGAYAGGTLADTDGVLLDQMISVNFKTAYHVVQPLFAHMSEQPKGGRFVLIGARQPLTAQLGQQSVAYTLSKSLLFQLSDLINASGKAHNIVSTVIAPSTIDTPANRQAMPNVDFTTWVDPQRIADTILFVFFGAGRDLRETELKLFNQA